MTMAKLDEPGPEREAVLDAFLKVCQWTRIYFSWRPNLRDESDNHLVELAVAAADKALVSTIINFESAPEFAIDVLEGLLHALLDLLTLFAKVLEFA